LLNQTSNKKPRVFANIFLHLHPAAVREEAIEFNRTFGLGGMAALLIVIQFLSGILLRFYYDTFPGLAYDSIIFLQNSVLFVSELFKVDVGSKVERERYSKDQKAYA